MSRISTFLILVCFSFLTSSLISQDVISIAEARQVDAEGSLTRLGQQVELTGIAIGPNFRAGGHTWVLFDTSQGIGITVFAFNNDVGYTVTDGDELRIVGELDEFNGLAELVPETIEILSMGNAIPEPQVVTELSELSEANLIKVENVMLVDESQWAASNFNVDVTDGTNTFQMRVDGDINIAGMPAPKGSFDLIGIGGQFDNSAPYTSGYQIFPRSTMDIDPYDTGGNTGIQYEAITLEQSREVDANGNATRLDDNVEVRGVTHGINFRPSGLQFTIINENNVGLSVFSTSNTVNYNFAEGDELIIKGKIDQFNGLTQLSPDSLFVVSQNNDLVTPRLIPKMDESSEGSLVLMVMSGWVDESDWNPGGSGFNISFLNEAGEEQTIRVDADTELFNSPIPDGYSFVTGIVGQFDSSEPRDEGYQLFPTSLEDFDPLFNTNDQLEPFFTIYPNPARNEIFVNSEIKINSIRLLNSLGQIILTSTQDNHLTFSSQTPGMYMLWIDSEEGNYVKRIILE